MAEHEGRTPQPGVPSGPRNTPGAHHGGGLGGVIGDIVSGIGHAAGDVVHAVTGAASDAAAATQHGVAHAYHDVQALPPPPALRASAPSLKAPEATALGSYLGRLLTPGGALSALLGGIHVTSPTAPSLVQEALADYRGALANTPHEGILQKAHAAQQQLASLRGNHAPANPHDPLGARTLGDVSLAQLAKARQQGTLRVSKAGVLTTPPAREAVRDLRAAASRVAATNGIETGLGPNADAFAKALADYTHLNPRAVGAWVASEGGAYEAGGQAGPQNWLGVGYPGHPTAFGRSPQFSGTPERAGRATGAWMEGKIGGGYGYRAAPGIQAIVPSAAHAGPQAFVGALAASGWGTDVAHVQQNLSRVGVRSDPQAVQALQVAKHNARAQGINPTPFNGDVAGGGSGFTIVRADAKGMVDWAESALGTQEGSGKQRRWAGKFGLGTTEPWCANFVSNGLLRRGFSPAELPANPNNTGTPGYEQWASEGKHAVNVGTDLRKAKPGDILTFSGAHTAVYVGGGEMVSGNFSNEVERTPVSSGPAPLSMIIRPKYKGGKVRIADSELAGSTAAAATGTPGGEVGVAGAVPAAAGAGGGRRPTTSVALTQLAAPISAGPVLPDAYQGQPEDEAHGSAAADTITALLGDEPLTYTRRPSL